MKISLRFLIGLFGLTVLMSCGKEVKSPSSKPASAAKTTSAPATQPPGSNTGESQDDHTCGSNAGSSGNQTGY